MDPGEHLQLADWRRRVATMYANWRDESTAQPETAAQTELRLDFNLAYHPSCAYDPRWNCPPAPVESRLDIPIRAGERLY